MEQLVLERKSGKRLSIDSCAAMGFKVKWMLENPYLQSRWDDISDERRQNGDEGI